MAWYWWAFFFAVVAVLLGLDLGLFQKKTHSPTLREALAATGLRAALALAFNAGIYLGWIGSYATVSSRQEAGLEFLTAYLIEIALSINNVFVFALVFRAFRVDSMYQHRVLFWGILGALAMRAVLIFAGLALMQHFHWVLYVFAAILIFGGIKMLKNDKDEDPSFKDHPILRFVRRFLPVTSQFHEQRFMACIDGKWFFTPLFIVLLMIESTDLIFAVDSIPAVLAVSRDPFIVFTSNVFAILGLRALYFALASILNLFHLLNYGLSVILIFIGAKMLLAGTSYEIPTIASLAVVVAILVASIGASLVWPKPMEASLEE